MKVSEFLEGIGNTIAFYPDVVPIAGTHQAAIFLCQLIYWQGKQSNPEGWIYKTQKEWFLETGLTTKEQKGVRRILKERGLIEERKLGTPARLEYLLKEQEIMKYWNAWMIAVKIKKKYLTLDKEYRWEYSQAVLDKEIKNQIDSFYQAIEKCETTANKFFKKCKKNGQSPISLIDELHDSLKQIAQKLPPIEDTGNANHTDDP